MRVLRDSYELTDDKTRLNLDVICDLLHASYWAADRPRAVTAKSIQHSFCLGLFYGGQQVGFSRAVTDHATFTWICDVMISPEHRGRGLGKWMVETLIAHPELQTRSQLLSTKDAHTLYERYGFKIAEQDYLKKALPFP